MKYILKIAIICIFGYVLIQQSLYLRTAVEKFVYRSPCDNQVPYSLGLIDSRFQISRHELLVNSRKAADIWGTYNHRDMLVYEPDARLKINLVFDERQQLKNQISSMEDVLVDKKNSIEPLVSQYELEKTDFQKRWDLFVQEVNKWNAQGGAPQEEYDRLIAERSLLEREAARLNDEAKKLNLQTQSYNAQVNTLNQTVHTFDETLDKKPEEGMYDPKTETINIYFNNNTEELIHTIAHELGHAIGIDHVNDPQAIMFFYANESVSLSDADRNELNAFCKKQSLWDIGSRNLNAIFSILLRRVKVFLDSHQYSLPAMIKK